MSIHDHRKQMTATPHKQNAAGDFYVEESCCLSCAVPFSEAPGLFRWGEDGQCYVGKQPGDAVELEQMFKAFSVAEAGCIRYRGNQRAIQIRLVQSGEGAQCDHLEEDLADIHRSMSAKRMTSEYGGKGIEERPSLLGRLWVRLFGDA